MFVIFIWEHLHLVTDNHTGRRVMANTIIIERDTKLPVSVTKRYTTIHEGQEELNVMLHKARDQKITKNL